MDALVRAIQQASEASMSDMYICLPGEIVSYNPTTNRATVLPSLSKRTADAESLAPPQIVNVPVVWPSADVGGQLASFTMPLKPGDGVLLHFCQRSMDEWIDQNRDAPSDPRSFDITDAIAVPGLNNRVVPGDPEDVVLRFGSAALRIKPDGTITLGNAAGALTLEASGELTLAFSNVTSLSDIRAANVSVATHRHVETNTVTEPPING